MEVVEFANGKEFLLACNDWLHAYPLHNNMILGHVQNNSDQNNGQRYFALSNHKKIVSTALWMNGRLMVGFAKGLEYESTALVVELLQRDNSIASVFALKAVIENLPEEVRIGAVANFTMLLQQCRSVNAGFSGIGVLRHADVNDMEWISEWIYQFWQSVHIYPKPDRTFAINQTREKIASNQLYYLEHDGVPCAMGGIMRIVADTAYIGLIYTPASMRGKGYGYALSMILTDHLNRMNQNAVGLYSELENTPANRIYQRVGFKVIDQFTDLHLSSKSHT